MILNCICDTSAKAKPAAAPVDDTDDADDADDEIADDVVIVVCMFCSRVFRSVCLQ